MSGFKLDAQSITAAVELFKLGVQVVQNHRKANSQPLDEPVTVDEILAFRDSIRDTDDLIEQGLRGTDG